MPEKLPGLSKNAPLEQILRTFSLPTQTYFRSWSYRSDDRKYACVRRLSNLTPKERLQNGGKDTGDEAENGHAQITQLKKKNKTKTEIRTGLSKELTTILPIIYR